MLTSRATKTLKSNQAFSDPWYSNYQPPFPNLEGRSAYQTGTYFYGLPWWILWIDFPEHSLVQLRHAF